MLSKTEIQYLQGNKQVSATFAYKLNHSIKKKVARFINLELPLLQQNHILDLISIQSLGKAKVAGPNPAQGFLFSPKESQFEVFKGSTNSDSTLPNSVRILPNSVRLTNDSRIDWVKYEQYLEKNFNKPTAKARYSYSKKFHSVLANGDATSLAILSFDKRMHVMKGLATLSKFLGCYDKWKKIVENYQLSWSDNGKGGGAYSKGLEIFHNIYGNNNYQEMIKQLKNACSNLDKKYSSVLLYCTLTGLRPAEACISIKLLKERKQDYLSKDNRILEHFKFPEVFMRRTKNSYISIVFEKISEIIDNSESISYDSIRLALRRQNLKMNMSICRKIFATFLRNEGIEQEIIDLLHGRIPKSVFVRHYYRPDLSKFDMIREKLTKLHKYLITE